MDICVEYMQDLSGVIDQGSLVAIYSATQIATQQGVNYIPKNLPVSNPKTRWLFVKGVPDSWSGTLIMRHSQSLIRTMGDGISGTRSRRV